MFDGLEHVYFFVISPASVHVLFATPNCIAYMHLICIVCMICIVCVVCIGCIVFVCVFDGWSVAALHLPLHQINNETILTNQTKTRFSPALYQSWS